IGGGTAQIALCTLLESVLGPHHYRREGVLLAIWLTGLAGYWAFRQFAVSAWASFLAALLLMLCGSNLTFPMNGLLGRAFTLAFAALSIGLMERGRRTGRWLHYPAAGGMLGLAISETPDVGIIFALCCAGYFFLSHFSDPLDWQWKPALKKISGFALYVVASGVVAWQIVGIMFATQIEGMVQGASENKQEKYDWATQWSLPVVETWSLFAADYHGASNRSAQKPYWGGIGRNAGWERTHQGFRNFRLAGYAVGAIPLLFIIVFYAYLLRHKPVDAADIALRKQAWILLFFAVVFLMLSWGRHFPLYRLVYALPYMGTIRNPDKWLGPFTLFFSIMFTLAADTMIRLRAAGKPDANAALLRSSLKVLLVIPGIAALGIFTLVSSKEGFIKKLMAEGYGEAAQFAWQNALGANLQLIVVLTLAFLVLRHFLCKPSGKFPALWLGLIGLGIAVELCKAGLPYANGVTYKAGLQPNPLTAYLDQHRTDGRLKLMSSPREPLANLFNNWRLTMLMAKGYNLFDPVSVSRMPADYQALFDAFNSNPVRLWQLGAMRYFICTPNMVGQLMKQMPEGAFKEVLAFGAAPVDGTYLPTTNMPADQRYLKLLEFAGALPMFRLVPKVTVLPETPEGGKEALKRMADPAFDPASEALLHVSGAPPACEDGTGAVQVIGEEPASATLRVSADQKGLLLRAVNYHPDWKVTIDNRPAALWRVNFMFQGVIVPAGLHQVAFSFEPSQTPFLIAILGRILLMGLVVLPVLRKRDETAAEV
ncbi:MAG: hypothetical protein HY343_08125, partial [Lentisphaerae bacterium]|nr:hypothetical protein [Lentisphaerota bacterium]